jgi:hypothetical protein
MSACQVAELKNYDDAIVFNPLEELQRVLQRAAAADPKLLSNTGLLVPGVEISWEEGEPAAGAGTALLAVAGTPKTSRRKVCKVVEQGLIANALRTALDNDDSLAGRLGPIIVKHFAECFHRWPLMSKTEFVEEALSTVGEVEEEEVEEDKVVVKVEEAREEGAAAEGVEECKGDDCDPPSVLSAHSLKDPRRRRRALLTTSAGVLQLVKDLLVGRLGRLPSCCAVLLAGWLRVSVLGFIAVAHAWLRACACLSRPRVPRCFSSQSTCLILCRLRTCGPAWPQSQVCLVCHILPLNLVSPHVVQEVHTQCSVCTTNPPQDLSVNALQPRIPLACASIRKAVRCEPVGVPPLVGPRRRRQVYWRDVRARPPSFQGCRLLR